MEPFKKHTGIIAPLDRANVDTDQIIPKQFLKKIERTGFGVHLFHDWRYEDDDEKIENADFILNKEPYRKSTILLSRENFGCGSSREHAPWALADFGFRAVIAPSYADIFFNNCFKNGMLPVILKAEEVDEIFAYARDNKGAQAEVDLENQKVVAGEKSYSFEVDPFRKENLLNGWDDIGLTLKHQSEIEGFEKEYFSEHPYYKPASR
jgi:3-isopropylmalate/(R)-2-methylmalate dehydratase small subunit